MATTESANSAVPSVPTGSQADYQRGVRYLLGDGVTQNLLSSRDFFQRAAQQGQQDAADILSLLSLNRAAANSGWVERYPKTFVAGALIPVFLLILALAVLPVRRSSSGPAIGLPAGKTSARIPATGGNHGHRR